MIAVALRSAIGSLFVLPWSLGVAASGASPPVDAATLSIRPTGRPCYLADDNFAAVRFEVGSALMLKNETADFDSIRRSLSCLKQLWTVSGEGELRAEVSDAYLAVLHRFPVATLRFFLTEPDVFSEWLTNLQNRSFVWGRPPPCGLETLRLDVIASLEQRAPTLRAERKLKSRLMRELHKIRCRQVD